MTIIHRFFDICLFKAGPADLPASRLLLQLVLLSYFLLGIVISLMDDKLSVSIFTSLADLLVMIAVIGLLLKFRGFQARFQQTLTAMAGAGCCLTIVGLPIVWWFYQIDEQHQATSFAMLLMIALVFWSLMVNAHIFRYALEIKPSTAVIITVAYTVLSIVATGLTMSGVA